MSARTLLLLVSVTMLLPAARGGDDKDAVHRKVSAAVLEDVLGKLKIGYRKAASDNGPVVYDYERQGFKIRLSNFGGTDLMLAAAFDPTPVDKINAWNIRAKFSRGVLYTGAKPYTAIESNLDCVGGVTSGAIKQFLERFDSEVGTFAKFLGEGRDTTEAAPATPQTEKVHPGVSNELIEKVLRGLKIDYRKTAADNGAGFTYDYQRHNVPVRLIDFGGKDVMLTSEFRKASLQEANDFNLKRNFIRAVVYHEGGRTFTALERNLDTEGGVTEAILRNFIARYDGDIQEFQRFLATQKKDAEEEPSSP
jgi:Putative bacterial sensory transduction regulator